MTDLLLDVSTKSIYGFIDFATGVLQSMLPFWQKITGSIPEPTPILAALDFVLKFAKAFNAIIDVELGAHLVGWYIVGVVCILFVKLVAWFLGWARGSATSVA